METIASALEVAVDLAWGTPLVVLLLVGGAALLVYSRFVPFRGLAHAVEVLRGKYDDPDDPGEISHFQALSTALSSTIGMGNIAGVAVAISQGGPGAIFWMWVAALVGMATKFFTCTLAVLYRGTDSRGTPQGGPMYYIEEGLGPRWRFLAVLFSICGMIGCLAMFQTNQLAEILVEAYDVSPWTTGIVSTAVVTVVVLGGLQRIAKVASRLVPTMCVVYLVLVGAIVLMHIGEVPAMISLIVRSAFDPQAAFGGAAGVTIIMVIRTGVKRAAFSNEAGIGTAPMAHGAAKTDEPVREGLVAMIGPFVDTVVVCSLTAFAILATGAWSTAGVRAFSAIGAAFDATLGTFGTTVWSMEVVRGVSLTLLAFETSLGAIGKAGLMLVVVLFAFSTMFGYSYYGRKCFGFLFGVERARIYDFFFVAMLLVGAVWSAGVVVNLLDTAFALMAFPNMIATLILAPRVIRATRGYFARMADGSAIRSPTT